MISRVLCVMNLGKIYVKMNKYGWESAGQAENDTGA